MMCKRHPFYKAIRKPSSNCGACWAIWLEASEQAKGDAT